MLTADDYLNFSLDDYENEWRRLDTLYREIGNQSKEQKRILTQGFITIIENTDKNILKRMSACVKVGNFASALGIRGCSSVRRRLCAIINQDFMKPVGRRSWFFPSKKYLYVANDLHFQFLHMLAVALLRVDYPASKEFVLQIHDLLENPSWRQQFADSLESEKERGLA